MISFKKILVPIDIARGSRAQLTVVHVVDLVSMMSWGADTFFPDNGRARLIDHLRKQLEEHVVREKAPETQIETMIVEGKPFSRILEIAENRNMDMIVLNLQSKSTLERAFLGSTAERVVRLARTPVLSIPIATGV